LRRSEDCSSNLKKRCAIFDDDRRIASHNSPVSRAVCDRSRSADGDQLQKLCETTGQKPGEAIRELVDEALRARRNALSDVGRDAGWLVDTLQQVVEQNRQLVELNRALFDENRTIADRSENVLEACEDTREHADSLNYGLKQNFHVFYAILLQTLFASLSSRRMAWNYVARTVLEASGVSDEEMTRRYEYEVKAAVMEGNDIAKAAEESVGRAPFPDELDLDTHGGREIEDNDIPF
jgi:hypothetical protein